MFRKKPVAHSATKEERRLVRGALAEAIVDLNNKVRFANELIEQHRLEHVMSGMIDLTHEGRKKSD